MPLGILFGYRKKYITIAQNIEQGQAIASAVLLS